VGEYEKDGLSALVDGARKIAKPFLACRVPDLQFDAIAVEFDSLDLEVDANRCHVGLVVVRVHVPQQQVRLPHC
jgi:hypothetical protein